MRRFIGLVIVVAVAAGVAVAFWPATPTVSAERVTNDREPVVESPAFRRVEVETGTPGGFAVAGVVRDASGAPVAGAEVSLASSEQQTLSNVPCGHCEETLLSCRSPHTALTVASLLDGHQGIAAASATTTSDTHGQFRFEGVRGVSFTVWARAAGHGVGVKDRVAPGDPVELFVTRPRRLAGLLRNERGEPVIGSVRVVSHRLPQVETRESDGQGRFTFEGLGEGPFYVLATAPGLLPAATRGAETSREVVLTLATPRRLEVRVVDADKKPAAATVRIVNNHLSLSQQTDDGLAVVPALPPGSVLVTAVSGDRAAVPQAVRLLSQTTHVTLQLDVAGTLAVSVVDEQSAPVPAATVHLLTLAGEVLNKRELQPGELALLGPVAVGEYELRVTADGYSTLTMSATVKQGETPLEVSLTSGTVIAGRVLDEYGRPAAGVSVLVMPLGVTALSGPDGRFKMTVPSAGVYSLQAHHSDWGGGEKSVTAPANDVVLQLEPRAGCAVIVTLNGERVEGASVSLAAPTSSYRSDRVSGADGVVLMRGLPAGQYTLSASHPDALTDGTQLVTLDDGRLSECRATLKPGAQVTGKVIDEKGAPVVGVAVNIAPRQLEASVTDALGAFSFKPLRPNMVVTLRVANREYEQREVVSALAGGGPVTINVRRYETFHGRVLGAGQPLKRFRIESHEIVSSDGTFELPLPEMQENVIVTVESPGYEPLTASRPRRADLGTFDLRRLPSITGRVRDASGPVVDAVVTCDSCEQPVLTDSDGRFVLPKPYLQRELRLFARKGRASTTRTIDAETTSAGELVLMPATRVSGTVWLEGGRPAPGVEVFALNADRGNDQVSAVTAGDGSYSLDVAEGSYRFAAASSGMRGVDQLTIVMKVGSSPTRLDFGPSPGSSSLSVRLAPREGWALWLVRGEARVSNPLTLLHSDYAQLLYQPQTERVTLTGLPPGRYTVVWGAFFATQPPRLVTVDVPSSALVDLVAPQPGGAF